MIPCREVVGCERQGRCRKAWVELRFSLRGSRRVLVFLLKAVALETSGAAALHKNHSGGGAHRVLVQRPSCRALVPAARCALCLSSFSLSKSTRCALQWHLAMASSRVSVIACFWMASSLRRFPSVLSSGQSHPARVLMHAADGVAPPRVLPRGDLDTPRLPVAQTAQVPGQTPPNGGNKRWRSATL